MVNSDLKVTLKGASHRVKDKEGIEEGEIAPKFGAFTRDCPSLAEGLEVISQSFLTTGWELKIENDIGHFLHRQGGLRDGNQVLHI